MTLYIVIMLDSYIGHKLSFALARSAGYDMCDR